MLTQSCETLPGVGPVLAAKLQKCGIRTIGDLLFYFPFRYQDRTRITPLKDVRHQEHCVIAGQITQTKVSYGKRKMLYCFIADKTGIITLRFFHFNQQQVHSFKQGQWLRAFGEIRTFAQQIEMIHPEYQLLDNEHDIVMEETLTPVYPTTEGLSQTHLRRLIKTALSSHQGNLKTLEWLTGSEREQFYFPSIDEAVVLLHNPHPDTPLQILEEGLYPPLRRIAFDELVAHQLAMQFAKNHRNRLSAPRLPREKNLQERFLKQLPFALTASQHKVCEEIAEDLTKTQPMLRLVQGDVGCGKTTVAAVSALQAIAEGFQVALMAPTELLSEQHANNFQRWLAPLGIESCRLSGKMTAKEKRQVLAKLSDHSCQLLIGTHALFQEQVSFNRLGLIIIDEQHRFGVEQRLLLQQKGQKDALIPHQLLMTATPIPRTLAMTRLLHFEISVIDELPPGRIPVQTAIISEEKRDAVIARINAVVQSGAQAYWICTLIEESDNLQCQAASITAQKLQQQLPNLRIGLIHGRMKAQEKETVMTAFQQKQVDVLVATTVIEVGVDVPNASLMIIENSERLGLTQIHQLRGRVGRGNQQSFCLLLYQSPLSQTARERLHIMRAHTDGFLIAEKDLQLRGAGEILGTRQTGYQPFKIANLQRDKDLIVLASRISGQLLHKTPDTAKKVATRWLGEFEQFLQG